MEGALLAAVDGYTDSQEDGASDMAFATVMEFVPARVPLQTLIQGMGPFLTNDVSRVRRRATDLLARLLEEVPDLPLTKASVHHLSSFLTSRLSDYPSVGPCLRGLLALFRNHVAVADPLEFREPVKEIFGELHVPAMEQALRQATFDLLAYLLATPRYLEGLRTFQADLAVGFVNAMDGEKDPRCLLTCLGIARRILSEFGNGGGIDDVVEELFDVTACYFPITFTPPPNDPYGITKEALIDALRGVFTSCRALAPYVIPLLLEKLDASSEDAKLDSLETMCLCIREYRVEDLQRFLSTISKGLLREILNGEESRVTTGALAAVSELSRGVGVHRESTGEVDPWDAFAEPLISGGLGEITKAPESLVGRASGKILGAIAEGAPYAHKLVLDRTVGALLKLHREASANSSSQSALLAVLVGLVRAADPHVAHSVDAHPLRSYAKSLGDVFRASMSHSEDEGAGGAGSASSSAETVVVRLGIEGLVQLATRSPTCLIADEQLNQLVDVLSNMLVGSSHSIAVAAQHALTQLASKLPSCATVIASKTIPALLERLGGTGVTDADVSQVMESLCQLSSVAVVLKRTVPGVMKVAMALHCTTAGSDVSTLDVSAGKLFQGLAMIVRLNCKDSATADHLVRSDEDDAGDGMRLVPTLLNCAVHSAMSKQLVDDDILGAMSQILSAVTLHASESVQDELRLAVADLFLNGGTGDACAALGVKANAEFAPLSARAHITAQRVVALLPAVLGGSRMGAPIPHFSELVEGVLRFAQGEHSPETKLASMASARLLGALVNAAPANADSHAAVDAAAKQLLGRMRDVELDILLRQQAAKVFVWVLKGLAIRPGAALSASLIEHLCDFLVQGCKEAEAHALYSEAATAFQVICNDSGDILVASTGARVSPLYKQRIFGTALATLAPSLRGSADTTVEERQWPLLAVCSMIPEVPASIYSGDLDSLVLVTLQCLALEHLEASYAALASLDVLLGESLSLFAAHLDSLVPTLLRLTTAHGKPKVRYLALRCIQQLAGLPYHKIHPHRTTVYEGLQDALDDRKRVVRGVAVVARNTWSLIGS